MKVGKFRPLSHFPLTVLLSAVLFLSVWNSLQAQMPVANAPEPLKPPVADTRDTVRICETSPNGSPYIPVDSWVYPAVLRLYSMGYIDHVYLNMRPWTRSSLIHILEGIEEQIMDADTEGNATVGQAQDILSALSRFLDYDISSQCVRRQYNERVESLYSMSRVLSGTPLRDSFHLGSTVINDYGRPYAHGLNNYSGASGYATAGRFLLYARGEFQGAPSTTGYSTALAQTLSNVDSTTFLNPATGLPFNQATIPLGPIAATDDGRLLEAYVSTNISNHIISFGKQDEWLGPALGASMAYSNNAENIYALHINRIEPLRIPGLSVLTGPFRYEFLVGSLKGHTGPNDPWVHVEKVSFRPTRDLEFGFERTVIWGGKGHEAINLHTFLRSFLSLTAPTPAVKFSSGDPGARFGAFDFSYRLPLLRNWLTLYSDSEVHDDISAIDNPSRGAWRPGIYLSHVPYLPKLDIRVEASDTDPPVDDRSIGGEFMYWESVQTQGYTNKGQLFGDWIGREDKGGQAWITYHLSGNEWLQLGLRNQKADKDFIPGSTAQSKPGATLVFGGTTLNDIDFQVVKRVKRDLEIKGSFNIERWKAPVYLAGPQTVTNTTLQLTWFPHHMTGF